MAAEQPLVLQHMVAGWEAEGLQQKQNVFAMHPCSKKHPNCIPPHIQARLAL